MEMTCFLFLCVCVCIFGEGGGAARAPLLKDLCAPAATAPPVGHRAFSFPFPGLREARRKMV